MDLISPVDNLWTTRRKHAQVIHIFAMYLTKPVRSILAGEPLWRIARGRCLVLLGVLCIVGTTPAEANPNINNLKLYAHSRIIDYKEFQCFNRIITKESNWRIDAVNGSHYGLGQMRNKKYRTLDGFTQIDWTLRYIKARYSTSCKAWAFHQKRNYF
jgi:hypothetical protein